MVRAFAADAVRYGSLNVSGLPNRESGKRRRTGKADSGWFNSVTWAGKAVGGERRGDGLPWGRHTDASVCRSTSWERWWGNCYEESK
jgi:hypothetical protein